VRDHLGAEAEELPKHRFCLVNVWRPIRGPVLDSPLALCDARTFTDADLITSDLIYPLVRGETSRVEFNPEHRCYYFSEQQQDEVLLIRVHDSANDGRARMSFHGLFGNPLTPGSPPRAAASGRRSLLQVSSTGHARESISPSTRRRFREIICLRYTENLLPGRRARIA
jgi:hypothetical protein